MTSEPQHDTDHSNTEGKLAMMKYNAKKLALTSLAPAALAVLASPALADQPAAQADEAAPAEAGEGGAITASSKDGQRLNIELGVLPRYVGNYFESQDEFNVTGPATPAKSVAVITLSGTISYDLISEQRKRLTAAVRLRHNIFTDLDNANSTDVDVTLTYDARPSQFRLGYFGTRHKLVSDSPTDPVYGKTDGFSAAYLHRLTKRLRGQVGYRYSHTGYALFPDRNLDQHQYSAELRYQVQRYFMPAVGVEHTRGNAALDSRSYKRNAFYLSVTSEIGQTAYINLRYRHSKREYLTDLPTDSYFGREDPRDDFSAYGTVQLGGGLSLFGFFNHTTNDSNQPSHRFKSDEGGLGLFYRF